MDTLFNNTVSETAKEDERLIEQALEKQRLIKEVSDEVKKILEGEFAIREDTKSEEQRAQQSIG